MPKKTLPPTNFQKRGFILRHYKFLTLILFVGIWSVLLYHISPEEIVDRFGVHNGYLIAFSVSFLAALSTFISFPYHLIIYVLGAGGLNPLLLGISAGCGEFLGDSVSYLVGYHGHHVLPTRLQKIFRKFTDWCIKGPWWVTSSALFLYGAFVPFPNDLIIIPLAFGHHPYLRMMIPIGLGNIFFNTMVASFGWYSYR